jgi:glycosyltransferase involved in cell wall biosynthesis
MKILIAQDHLSPGDGEAQTLALAADFAKAGHQVTLLTFRPRSGLAQDGEQQPFAFRSLQRFDTRLNWFAPGLLATVTEAAPDVLLCLGRIANCYAGFIQRRRPGVVVVCTVGSGKPLPGLLLSSLRMCRQVVADSQAEKRNLADLCDLPAHRISVIPPSIRRFTDENASRNNALRRYHGANPTTVVLLNVAMFRPKNDQRELIGLCAKLPGYFDWQLWLAGEGPERKKSERLAHDLGLGGRVRFIGFQSDPSPLYLAADLAVLTAQTRTLPDFLIEAQLHGVPVVAYDVGAVSECFVPDRSGCLVANHDQAGFVATLDRLIRQPAERRRYAHAGREYAQANFVPARRTQALLNLFRELTRP